MCAICTLNQVLIFSFTFPCSTLLSELLFSFIHHGRHQQRQPHRLERFKQQQGIQYPYETSKTGVGKVTLQGICVRMFTLILQGPRLVGARHLLAPTHIRTRTPFLYLSSSLRRLDRQQSELKTNLILNDDHPDWSVTLKSGNNTHHLEAAPGLKYIGGVDLSFIVGNNEDAIASLIVLSYPKLKVIEDG